MSKDMEPDNLDRADTKTWYTVQEAAHYLDVSQPTVFRWMKQGILSFYKVGGATRFSKEGLDAVVEKTTGLKEAEAAAGRCARCGHSVLIQGSLQGTGKLYFRPSKSRFWVLAEALVPTNAIVCAACGHLHLHVDTAKLKRLSTETENPHEPGGDKAEA
jgi:excisionase family DNA binding protein